MSFKRSVLRSSQRPGRRIRWIRFGLFVVNMIHSFTAERLFLLRWMPALIRDICRAGEDTGRDSFGSMENYLSSRKPESIHVVLCADRKIPYFDSADKLYRSGKINLMPE